MFKHLDPIDLPIVKSENSATGKHFYRTPEGEVYPSITTILGHKEKPYLVAWQQSLGKDKAAKETKRCSDRGSAVHEMSEQYLNNGDITTFSKLYKPEHIKGFNQLKVRLNKIDNIRYQEVALYSDSLRLAGRVDCIGEYDGVLTVIDFKTSNNNKDSKMIEDYYLQCTAYALMWYEMTGELIEDIAILMSVERGMVPLVFKEKIDKYIQPLQERINEYYRDKK